MSDYKWHPIQPLSMAEENIDLAAMKPLYESWRAYKDRLGQTDTNQLEHFNQQLIRRLSVETGIIERLYDLDRGTTEALVLQGFVADLVTRSDTNIDPARVIEYLRDQEAAIQLVVDCIAGSRELTKGLIHELHSILTRHQDTTDGIDLFGNRVQTPLLKGRYKQNPNNPRRAGGSLHEYCPPVHVESEMDNLLGWFQQYGHVDPIISAAWLHHRFAQVHPYQDGNGRLSRVLVTYVLLRANLLPLVIDRDMRADYIRDLEVADSGDLSSLARIFARLERIAILQALSLEEDIAVGKDNSLSLAVLSGISKRLAKQKEDKLKELRKVNSVALLLRATTKQYLDKVLEGVGSTLGLDHVKHYSVEEGSDEGHAHWYKFQIGKTARKTGRFANFTEDHYFVKTVLRAGTDRLTFITSFHHAGRELSGIMEVTAFATLENDDTAEDAIADWENFVICSLDPFVITYKTSFDEVKQSFTRWLDGALAVALKEFGDTL